jgi:hypothetical protein
MLENVVQQFHDFTDLNEYTNNQVGFIQKENEDVWYFARKEVSPTLILILNLVIHKDDSYSIVLENYIKKQDVGWESHSMRLNTPNNVSKKFVLKDLILKWNHKLTI